jgi:hypothetical protein
MLLFAAFAGNTATVIPVDALGMTRNRVICLDDESDPYVTVS